MESLVTLPITTHHGPDVAERTERGIADSMIRLAVGLEEADGLIADLAQALDAIWQPAPFPPTGPVRGAAGGRSLRRRHPEET
ncbi:PLP-dependent transferase [Streptomyces phyllanthi]|uniref:PLP-dependent transferase n=1 Tax=Streptomyces phyllanthi TaxID=1803180 RepID=UPI00337749D5